MGLGTAQPESVLIPSTYILIVSRLTKFPIDRLGFEHTAPCSHVLEIWAISLPTLLPNINNQHQQIHKTPIKIRGQYKLISF
jgi:hypothetical protein